MKIERFTNVGKFRAKFIEYNSKIVSHKTKSIQSETNDSILDRLESRLTNDPKDVFCRTLVLTSYNTSTEFFTCFYTAPSKFGQATTQYILENPRTKLDDRKRFHSVTGPAIEWDDFAMYFIHGVEFPIDLWSTVSKRTLKVIDLFKIENIEQRRVALEHYGSEKIFEELKPTLLDKSERGNKLWYKEVEMKSRWNSDVKLPLAFLQYRCPSTERQYISFVPETIKKADEAMAWKFQITEEQYSRLKIEA